MKRSTRSKKPQTTARWKPGYRSDIPADDAVDELRRISDEHGGRLHPADIVEHSRPPGATLHAAFQWDDVQAAENYRREQARTLVQHLVVVRSTPAGEISGPLFISVPASEEHHRGYVSTELLISRPDMRAAALDEARRGFETWQARYRWLEELVSVFAAAGRVFGSHTRKKKAG